MSNRSGPACTQTNRPRRCSFQGKAERGSRQAITGTTHVAASSWGDGYVRPDHPQKDLRRLAARLQDWAARYPRRPGFVVGAGASDGRCRVTITSTIHLNNNTKESPMTITTGITGDI